MRSEFLLRHRVSLASVVVVVAAVIAVVLYALSVPGYATHRAEINDGGVWVTKGASGLFGRFNKPIDQLDGYAYTEKESASPDIDIVQEGESVVAVDSSGSALYPVDPTSASLVIDKKVPMSGGAQVAVDGGTVALTDPAKGAVRAVAVERGSRLADLTSLANGKPLAVVGSGAAMAVSQDGTVYLAGAGKLVTVHRTASGFAKPQPAKITVPAGATLSVTAVGDQPVVLARTQDTATVVLPDGKTAQLSSATGAVLQQAGPSSDHVVLATPNALVSVPLSGGSPDTLAKASGGTPAAPAYLGPCLFAAWAGTPTGNYATSCNGGTVTPSTISEPSTDLTFRVNRDKIVLNDRKSGSIWNLDGTKPRPVDDPWKVAKPRNSKKQSKDDNQVTNARPRPPKPQADELGARPGRTTSLYVLDNDSDPSGGVLAVSSVTPKSGKGRLSISPDGQTVDLALPAGATQPVTFTYTINGAKGTPVSAPVSVAVRDSSENSKPTQRAGQDHAWTVPVGGTVTIPALNNWRDYPDGDPIVLSSAQTNGGTVSTTPDGQLIYVAPDKPGRQAIDYVVNDGLGGVAKGTVPITVQAADGNPMPATASPDYARGVANKPITIQPLANDLPGSDPTTPTATLRIVGNVANPAGAEVTTDPTTGTVTVKPSRPGPLTLNYQAGYGNAAPAKGVISVQVDPGTTPQRPVTAADTAVLHGQTPVTIDVLANDSDPAGNLLVVQQATPVTPDSLEVAVIDGRYLRLRSTNPRLQGVQSVDYTVTDGSTGDATGSVTVTQLPDSQAGPVTLDDYARVRSGQPVAVAVLDNDVSPSGSPLTLAKNIDGAPAGGQLVVQPASAGAAYVSGRVVRFVANRVAQNTTADVSYEAEDLLGTRQRGQLHVTIVPVPSKTNLNLVPMPPPLEGRANAGQTIRIKVPSSGVDPDGDPVMVTGLGSAPTLGRVLGTNARGIEYQAYPFDGNGGTDSFSYVVTDIYGASATGTVRVAVVPPGDPQPPVAVDDTVTTSPKTPVQVDVLANDLVATGDRVTVEPLSKSDPEVAGGQVKRDGERGPITVTSDDAKHPVQFSYTITNGITEATARVTVRALDTANLPPVAFDQYPPVTAGARSVDVDLLAKSSGNYDPDGSELSVAGPRAAVDGKVNFTLTKFPQLVPYVIKDGKGATATAAVYLPGIGAGAPVYKPGPPITIKPGDTKTIDIRQYVADPANKQVRTTVAALIKTSPADRLTRQEPKDSTHVTLVAAKGYNGPAALTFQVTNGKTLNDPTGLKAIISVPVQVGDDRPVLRCPVAPLQLTEGGKPVFLRPATYCHAWVPVLSDLDALPFTGAWKSQPAGVSFAASKGSTLTVIADSANARAGSKGSFTVSARGASAVINVEVVEAKRLEVSPLTVDGVEAGKARTIDLTSSLRSFLAKPTMSVVGTPVVTGAKATITKSGAKVTVTPDNAAKGTMRILYVATDVPRSSSDHQAPGEITLHLIGRPDAPTNVQPGRTVKSKTVDLSWTPPAANGTPISKYEVRSSAGTRTCSASPCAIQGLKNGQAYTFTVVAVNAIGPSRPSAPSGSATPDAVPTAVVGFAASNPQDHQLTLKWQALRGEFSPVTRYRVLGGAAPIDTTSTSVVASGLDNNQQYSFTIIAVNKKGPGPAATASGLRQSAGRPGTPQNLQIGYADDTATGSSKVQITWTPVQGAEVEGPTPITYKVTRSPGGPVRCPATDTTCFDTPAVGQSYTYSVTASNAANAAAPGRHTSSPATTPPFEVATKPGQVKNYSIEATGNDGEAKLTFDAPASNGKSSVIKCTVSGGETCGGWPSDGQPYPKEGVSGQTAKISGLPDGQSTDVTLVDCNGSTESNNADRTCGDPASDSVTTYGPIAPVQLTVTKSGTRVYWSYSGDANGKSATVSVRTTKGDRNKDVPASGRFEDSDSEEVGYGYTDTVTVTVSDPGRQPQSATGTQRTDDPPPKKYEVRHPGGNCGKGRNCVQVRIINFVQGGSAQCSAKGSDGIDDWGPVTLSPGSDGTSDWVGTAPQGVLFDTKDPYTYQNGTFDLSHDNNGLTCR